MQGVEFRDGAAILWLDRGPANLLDAGTLADLGAGLAQAQARADVGLVLIASRGPVFSAGADPTELMRPRGALPGLVAAILAARLPVVAVLPGNAMGAGLELALAAHGRIAHGAARLGLPEIALGLGPRAGASQLLPRLIGAGPALRLMLSGTPVTAAEALSLGLVDEVCDDQLIDRALALGRRLAAAPLVPAGERAPGLADGRAYQAAVAAARAEALASRMPAPPRIVDCVEAAQLLPLEAGLAFEAAAFGDLVASPEARGLFHAFQTERQATALPAGLAPAALPRLQGVALVGTGGPVAETARAALAQGLRVRLAAPDRAALTQTLEQIAARQAQMVAAGQLTETARDADWGRLSAEVGAAGLAGADLALVVPGADPAALPEGLPWAALAGEIPGAVTLYPPPAPGLLAEISLPPDSPPGIRPAVMAPVQALARRLGGKPVVCGPGGPVERRLRLQLARLVAALEAQGTARAVIAPALASGGIGAGTARAKLPPAPPGAAPILAAAQAALACEALRCLDEGVALRPGDVDAAAVLSGLFPRWQGGPLFQAEARGLMALRADLRERARGAPAVFAPPPLLDRLISEGTPLFARAAG